LVGIIWLLGGLGFYGLLIAQSLLDVYPPDDVEKVWSWALPTMMPTLLLIVAVQATEAATVKRSSKEPVIAYFFCAVTVLLSVFYLGVVIVTVLIPSARHESPLPIMERAQLWLGPFQGLVAGAFGVFYVHSKNRKSGG
jgi:hypothetical protein